MKQELNILKKTNASKTMVLLRLFLSTFYISAFTFGGGFVIMTFMKKKYVDELHWLDECEMLDFITLAQSSPGAIAVNAAVLVGWRVAGFAGMLTAVLGTILPPLIILSVVSLFYEAFASNMYIALVLKGMQAGAAAVIIDVVCNLGKGIVKRRSMIEMIIMIAAFIATFFLKINVVYIILTAILIGVGSEFLKHRKGKQI